MEFNALDVLGNLTVEEIDAVVKAGRELLKERASELKEARKAEREAEKAEREEAGREAVKNLEKGDALVVIFKGEETEAIFDKMTEKRFTVEVDGVKRSVMFNKFVKIGNLENAA